MKYIVCYSGGHSSALVAIESVRRFGKENVVLLNHNISSKVEHEDIKRYKQEIADFLGINITYANMDNYEEMTPLKIATKLGGFQFSPGKALCTYHLKTKPFSKWLNTHYKVTGNDLSKEITILYGFDKTEKQRISRRKKILKSMGYNSEYPLAEWKSTINNTEEIGIKRPITYKIFCHANCIGCLKAGRQHWYAVYCLYPNIFEEALRAESVIKHSIIKGVYLKELTSKYRTMKEKRIIPTDKINSNTFWSRVRKELSNRTMRLDI